MNYEDMEDIAMCVVTLIVATITDYFHTTGQAFVSSAIPIFICQMIMMMNDLLKKRNDGKGIIRSVIDLVKKDGN